MGVFAKIPNMKTPENVIESWWTNLQRPNRGDIAGGLVLLEHLRANFSLDIKAHKAEHSDQLRGATPSAVKEILQRFGENRPLSKEVGRTNRGLMKRLEKLLSHIRVADLQNRSEQERYSALDVMQRFLVGRARDWLNSQKLRFDYLSDVSSRQLIGNILAEAHKRGKKGEVAEYLVGAKLALRFPDLNVRNASYSAADEQANEYGDFQISDTVFHVSISPNLGHYQKCEANINEGMRVYLLVPDEKLANVRQVVIGNSELKNKVAVESIESFVSQNIEEISEFSGDKIPVGLLALFEKYHERLEQVELDLSLQIEIPAAFKSKS